MKDETRRKLQPLYRPLKLVLAAGAVLGYFYVVHLALDLKAKIDADEPSGEWIAQNENDIRPRYTGPQTADALLSTMRFDLGEEKSEAQTAKLKAHFERVLERGAVFHDNFDMLHFGPSLMRRFNQAAEYERLRVEERPDDADYPSIRALYELPESASWGELENALIDDDLKKWPDAKKRLDSNVNEAIIQNKKSTREALEIVLPIGLAMMLLCSWGVVRPFIQRIRSSGLGVFLDVFRDKRKAKLAALFALSFCALGPCLFLFFGPGSAHNWRDDYLMLKTSLRETQETQQTARKLLVRIRAHNDGISDFDYIASITEIRRQRGKEIVNSMLVSAAVLPLSVGMFAWVGIRLRRSLQQNEEETGANEAEE